MLEKFVASLLVPYLSEYAENVNAEQLNIDLWNGKASLNDLILKPSVLEKLQLPVRLYRGVCKRVLIEIPLKNLKSKPVVIEIDELMLCVVGGEERVTVELNKSAALDAEAKRKEEELNAFEAERKRLRATQQSSTGSPTTGEAPSSGAAAAAGASPTPVEEKHNTGYFSKLTEIVVNNIIIRVKTVHVRYEDPSSATIIGAILGGVRFVTTDEAGKVGFVDPTTRQTSHKKLEFDGLQMYCDDPADHDQQQHHDGEKVGAASCYFTAEEQPLHWLEWMRQRCAAGDVADSTVFGPVAGSVSSALVFKAFMRELLSKPYLSMRMRLDNVMAKLTRTQYVMLIRTASLFANWGEVSQFYAHRPRQPVLGGHAKAWWRYAINAVLLVVREPKKEALLARISEVCVPDYHVLYRDVVRKSEMSTEKQRAYRFITRFMTVKDMIAGRKYVYAQLANEIQMKRRDNEARIAAVQEEHERKNTGWMAWLRGKPGTPKDIQEEEVFYNELEKEYGLDPEAVAAEQASAAEASSTPDLPHEYCWMDVALDLPVFGMKAQLTTYQSTTMQLENLSCVVKQFNKPRSVEFAVIAQDLTLSNPTYSEELKQLVPNLISGMREASAQSAPLLRCSGALNPIQRSLPDTQLDASISVELLPLRIVIDPETVEHIIRFFDIPKGVDISTMMESTRLIASNATSAASAELTVALASAKSIQMRIDAAAPVIVLAQTLKGGGSEPALALSLGVMSFQTDPLTDSEKAKRLSESTSNPDALYYSSQAKFSNFYVEVTDIRNALTNPSSGFLLVPHVELNADVLQRILDTAEDRERFIVRMKSPSMRVAVSVHQVYIVSTMVERWLNTPWLGGKNGPGNSKWMEVGSDVSSQIADHSPSDFYDAKSSRGTSTAFTSSAVVSARPSIAQLGTSQFSAGASPTGNAPATGASATGAGGQEGSGASGAAAGQAAKRKVDLPVVRVELMVDHLGVEMFEDDFSSKAPGEKARFDFIVANASVVVRKRTERMEAEVVLARPYCIDNTCPEKLLIEGSAIHINVGVKGSDEPVQVGVEIDPNVRCRIGTPLVHLLEMVMDIVNLTLPAEPEVADACGTRLASQRDGAVSITSPAGASDGASTKDPKSESAARPVDWDEGHDDILSQTINKAVTDQEYQLRVIQKRQATPNKRVAVINIAIHGSAKVELLDNDAPIPEQRTGATDYPFATIEIADVALVIRKNAVTIDVSGSVRYLAVSVAEESQLKPFRTLLCGAEGVRSHSARNSLTSQQQGDQPAGSAAVAATALRSSGKDETSPTAPGSGKNEGGTSGNPVGFPTVLSDQDNAPSPIISFSYRTGTPTMPVFRESNGRRTLVNGDSLGFTAFAEVEVAPCVVCLDTFTVTRIADYFTTGFFKPITQLADRPRYDGRSFPPRRPPPPALLSVRVFASSATVKVPIDPRKSTECFSATLGQLVVQSSILAEEASQVMKVSLREFGFMRNATSEILPTTTMVDLSITTPLDPLVQQGRVLQVVASCTEVAVTLTPDTLVDLCQLSATNFLYKPPQAAAPSGASASGDAASGHTPPRSHGGLEPSRLAPTPGIGGTPHATALEAPTDGSFNDENRQLGATISEMSNAAAAVDDDASAPATVVNFTLNLASVTMFLRGTSPSSTDCITLHGTTMKLIKNPRTVCVRWDSVELLDVRGENSSTLLLCDKGRVSMSQANTTEEILRQTVGTRDGCKVDFSSPRRRPYSPSATATHFASTTGSTAAATGQTLSIRTNLLVPPTAANTSQPFSHNASMDAVPDSSITDAPLPSSSTQQQQQLASTGTGIVTLAADSSVCAAPQSNHQVDLTQLGIDFTMRKLALSDQWLRVYDSVCNEAVMTALAPIISGGESNSNAAQELNAPDAGSNNNNSADSDTIKAFRVSITTDDFIVPFLDMNREEVFEADIAALVVDVVSLPSQTYGGVLVSNVQLKDKESGECIVAHSFISAAPKTTVPADNDGDASDQPAGGASGAAITNVTGGVSGGGGNPLSNSTNSGGNGNVSNGSINSSSVNIPSASATTTSAPSQHLMTSTTSNVANSLASAAANPGDGSIRFSSTYAPTSASTYEGRQVSPDVLQLLFSTEPAARRNKLGITVGQLNLLCSMRMIQRLTTYFTSPDQPMAKIAQLGVMKEQRERMARMASEMVETTVIAVDLVWYQPRITLVGNALALGDRRHNLEANLGVMRTNVQFDKKSGSISVACRVTDFSIPDMLENSTVKVSYTMRDNQEDISIAVEKMKALFHPAEVEKLLWVLQYNLLLPASAAAQSSTLAPEVSDATPERQRSINFTSAALTLNVYDSFGIHLHTASLTGMTASVKPSGDVQLTIPQIRVVELHTNQVIFTATPVQEVAEDAIRLSLKAVEKDITIDIADMDTYFIPKAFGSLVNVGLSLQFPPPPPSSDASASNAGASAPPPSQTPTAGGDSVFSASATLLHSRVHLMQEEKEMALVLLSNTTVSYRSYKNTSSRMEARVGSILVEDRLSADTLYKYVLSPLPDHQHQHQHAGEGEGTENRDGGAAMEALGKAHPFVEFSLFTPAPSGSVEAADDDEKATADSPPPPLLSSTRPRFAKSAKCKICSLRFVLVPQFVRALVAVSKEASQFISETNREKAYNYVVDIAQTAVQEDTKLTKLDVLVERPAIVIVKDSMSAEKVEVYPGEFALSNRLEECKKIPDADTLFSKPTSRSGSLQMRSIQDAASAGSASATAAPGDAQSSGSAGYAAPPPTSTTTATAGPSSSSASPASGGELFNEVFGITIDDMSVDVLSDAAFFNEESVRFTYTRLLRCDVEDAQDVEVIIPRLKMCVSQDQMNYLLDITGAFINKPEESTAAAGGVGAESTAGGSVIGDGSLAYSRGTSAAGSPAMDTQRKRGLPGNTNNNPLSFANVHSSPTPSSSVASMSPQNTGAAPTFPENGSASATATGGGEGAAGQLKQPTQKPKTQLMKVLAKMQYFEGEIANLFVVHMSGLSASMESSNKDGKQQSTNNVTLAKLAMFHCRHGDDVQSHMQSVKDSSSKLATIMSMSEGSGKSSSGIGTAKDGDKRGEQITFVELLTIESVEVAMSSTVDAFDSTEEAFLECSVRTFATTVTPSMLLDTKQVLYDPFCEKVLHTPSQPIPRLHLQTTATTLLSDLVLDDRHLLVVGSVSGTSSVNENKDTKELCSYTLNLQGHALVLSGMPSGQIVIGENCHLCITNGTICVPGAYTVDSFVSFALHSQLELSTTCRVQKSFFDSARYAGRGLGAATQQQQGARAVQAKKPDALGSTAVSVPTTATANADQRKNSQELRRMIITLTCEELSLRAMSEEVTDLTVTIRTDLNVFATREHEDDELVRQSLKVRLKNLQTVEQGSARMMPTAFEVALSGVDNMNISLQLQSIELCARVAIIRAMVEIGKDLTTAFLEESTVKRHKPVIQLEDERSNLLQSVVQAGICRRCGNPRAFVGPTMDNPGILCLQCCTGNESYPSTTIECELPLIDVVLIGDEGGMLQLHCVNTTLSVSSDMVVSAAFTVHVRNLNTHAAIWEPIVERLHGSINYAIPRNDWRVKIDRMDYVLSPVNILLLSQMSEDFAKKSMIQKSLRKKIRLEAKKKAGLYLEELRAAAIAVGAAARAGAGGAEDEKSLPLLLKRAKASNDAKAKKGDEGDTKDKDKDKEKDKDKKSEQSPAEDMLLDQFGARTSTIIFNDTAPSNKADGIGSIIFDAPNSAGTTSDGRPGIFATVRLVNYASEDVYVNEHSVDARGGSTEFTTAQRYAVVQSVSSLSADNEKDRGGVRVWLDSPPAHLRGGNLVCAVSVSVGSEHHKLVRNITISVYPIHENRSVIAFENRMNSFMEVVESHAPLRPGERMFLPTNCPLTPKLKLRPVRTSDGEEYHMAMRGNGNETTLLDVLNGEIVTVNCIGSSGRARSYGFRVRVEAGDMMAGVPSFMILVEPLYTIHNMLPYSLFVTVGPKASSKKDKEGAPGVEAATQNTVVESGSSAELGTTLAMSLRDMSFQIQLTQNEETFALDGLRLKNSKTTAVLQGASGSCMHVDITVAHSMILFTTPFLIVNHTPLDIQLRESSNASGDLRKQEKPMNYFKLPHDMTSTVAAHPSSDKEFFVNLYCNRCSAVGIPFHVQSKGALVQLVSAPTDTSSSASSSHALTTNPRNAVNIHLVCTTSVDVSGARLVTIVPRWVIVNRFSFPLYVVQGKTSMEDLEAAAGALTKSPPATTAATGDASTRRSKALRPSWSVNDVVRVNGGCAVPFYLMQPVPESTGLLLHVLRDPHAQTVGSPIDIDEIQSTSLVACASDSSAETAAEAKAARGCHDVAVSASVTMDGAYTFVLLEEPLAPPHLLLNRTSRTLFLRDMFDRAIATIPAHASVPVVIDTKRTLNRVRLLSPNAPDFVPLTIATEWSSNKDSLKYEWQPMGLNPEEGGEENNNNNNSADTPLFKPTESIMPPLATDMEDEELPLDSSAAAAAQLYCAEFDLGRPISAQEVASNELGVEYSVKFGPFGQQMIEIQDRARDKSGKALQRQLPPPLDLVLNVATTTLSLVRINNDLLFIVVKDTRCHLNRKGTKEVFEFSISNFQIDDMSEVSPMYESLLFPLRPKRDAVSVSGMYRRTIVPARAYVSLQEVRFDMLPLALRFSDNLIVAVADFLAQMSAATLSNARRRSAASKTSSSTTARASKSAADDESLTGYSTPSSKTLFKKAPQSIGMMNTFVTIDSMAINPVTLRLWFSREDDEHDFIRERIHSDMASIISLMVQSCEDVRIDTPGVLITSRSSRASVHLERVGKAYVDGIMSKIRGIVLQYASSLPLVGAPIKFFSGIGSGATRFFREPIDGLTTSPEAFVKGIASGSAGLVTDVVGGGFGAISNLTGAGSKLAGLVGGPSAKERKNQTSSAVSGFASGVKGVVLRPMEGHAEEGAAGLMKGVGKGLLGVVANPISGMLSDVSRLTSTAAQLCTDTYVPDTKRLRKCRVFHATGGVAPYNALVTVYQYERLVHSSQRWEAKALLPNDGPNWNPSPRESVRYNNAPIPQNRWKLARCDTSFDGWQFSNKYYGVYSTIATDTIHLRRRQWIAMVRPLPRSRITPSIISDASEGGSHVEGDGSSALGSNSAHTPSMSSWDDIGIPLQEELDQQQQQQQQENQNQPHQQQQQQQREGSRAARDDSESLSAPKPSQSSSRPQAPQSKDSTAPSAASRNPAPAANVPVAKVAIYEHERKAAVLGWGKPLFNNDFIVWTSKANGQACPSKDDVRPPAGYTWAGQWSVSNDWEYAKDSHSTTYKEKCDKNDQARRRLWTRTLQNLPTVHKDVQK